MELKKLKLTREECSFFLILWGLSVFSGLLSIPAGFHFFQDINIENNTYFKIFDLKNTYEDLIYDTLMFSVFTLPLPIYFGFLIRRHIAVEKIIHPTIFSRNNLILGMITGLAISLLLSISNIYIYHFLPELKAIVEKVQPRPFYGFLAIFDSVFSEEILIRFFLISFLFLLFKKLKTFGYWLAITLSSVIFCVVHIFMGIQLMMEVNIFALPKLVVAGMITLGSLEGIVFGWFYWKKGLGLAILIHFLVEIIVLVIFPMIELTIATS